MRTSRTFAASRQVSACVAAILLGAGAAACSTEPSASPSTTAGQSVTTIPADIPEPATEPVTEPLTTASTIATTQSTTLIDAPSKTTPTTSAPATTTTEPGPPTWPLTGVFLDDAFTAGRPALVVKIDNASGARPQTGFNEADIVFEEIVNDSLSRFAMVFHSHGSDPVGPIRSGRIQDIDLFGSFQHPLFAWSGGNATVTAAIRASDLVDIGPARVNVYFRASDRKVPHNLYSNTTALWTKAPIDSQPPIPQFIYRSADATVVGSPSQGVTLSLDSVDSRWDWDPASGLYLRTMEGKKHMDRAGGQVSTNNVVVLVMNYLPGISGSPDAQTLGTGETFVFTGGNAVHGTWTRTDRLLPFTLTADNGTPITLTPGRTFVELPRSGTTTPLGPAG